MSHSRVVEREFRRQAESFARASDLKTPELTLRIADALGDPAPGLVLDLACGPGVLTPALCERSRYVVGLDLTDRTLRLAKESVPDPEGAAFVRGLAEAAPFVDAVFDAAVLRLVLHHFESPRAVLEEARRLLGPGGRLVVLDILTSDEPAVAELHNAIERLRDPSHTSLLRRGELTEMIASTGFEMREETVWTQARAFEDWARIIAEPTRMASLEVVLRGLARAGEGAGIELREEGDALWFTYRWGLFVARAIP